MESCGSGKKRGQVRREAKLDERQPGSFWISLFRKPGTAVSHRFCWLKSDQSEVASD